MLCIILIAHSICGYPVENLLLTYSEGLLIPYVAATKFAEHQRV